MVRRTLQRAPAALRDRQPGGWTPWLVTASVYAGVTSPHGFRATPAKKILGSSLSAIAGSSAPHSPTWITLQ